MMQLSFPFVRDFGRTMPFRVITSVGQPNPYEVNLQLGFKYAKKHSGHTKIKKHLFEGRDKVPCFYCKRPQTFNTATVEHLIPRARGGTNDYSNVTISCGPCNHYRQDYTIEQWQRIIETGINRSPYIILYNHLRDSGRLAERRYLR